MVKIRHKADGNGGSGEPSKDARAYHPIASTSHRPWPEIVKAAPQPGSAAYHYRVMNYGGADALSASAVDAMQEVLIQLSFTGKERYLYTLGASLCAHDRPWPEFGDIPAHIYPGAHILPHHTIYPFDSGKYSTVPAGWDTSHDHDNAPDHEAPRSALNFGSEPPESHSPSPPENPKRDDRDRDNFLAFLDEVAASSHDQKPPELDALGGEHGIGRVIVTPSDLLKAVESGFRAASVDALLEAGFSQSELEAVIAPLRTLQRRRRDGRLAREESDAALRMARILTHAEMTLGSRARALSWLRHPNRSFADQTPMSLLATEAGGRRVEDLLLRADYGQMA